MKLNGLDEFRRHANESISVLVGTFLIRFKMMRKLTIAVVRILLYCVLAMKM